MKTTTAVVILIVLVVALGGWYYWDNYGGGMSMAMPMQTSTTSTTTPTSGDGTPVSQNLILGLSASGTYLTAYNGMTVYTYAPDTSTPGSSACTGGCTTSWPPYTVQSAADINVSSATTGTVGTITRPDTGALQVTYNGAPLYFYAGDKNTGDTNGQGLGGVWYIVKP